MANFGVVDQTSGTAYGLAPSGKQYIFVGGNFPGGTITGLYLRVGNRGGATPSEFYNSLDVALYLGGNSSGPSGASKIWNSKYYTSAVSFGDDPSTFTSIVDGSNAAPNVVAASGWLWIAMRSDDGIRFASLSVNGSNSGDFQTFGITGLRASTNYESGAWDDPFPGNHTSSYSSVMQAYVTYTASASGIPKIMQAHARRRRM